MRRNKHTKDVVGSSGFSSNTCSLFTLTARNPLFISYERPKMLSSFLLGTLLLYETYINHISVLAAGAFLIDKHVVCLKQSKTQTIKNTSPEMDDTLKNHLKVKHLLNTTENIT